MLVVITVIMVSLSYFAPCFQFITFVRINLINFFFGVPPRYARARLVMEVYARRFIIQAD